MMKMMKKKMNFIGLLTACFQIIVPAAIHIGNSDVVGEFVYKESS
jgi:hypothetical protein